MITLRITMQRRRRRHRLQTPHESRRSCVSNVTASSGILSPTCTHTPSDHSSREARPAQEGGALGSKGNSPLVRVRPILRIHTWESIV